MLVPAEALRAEQVVQHTPDEPEWADREIEALARRFSVSREVVLRRLLILGLTEQSFYQRKRTEYVEEYREAEARRKQEEKEPRPIPRDLIAVARTGQYLSLLVLSSYARGRDRTPFFGPLAMRVLVGCRSCSGVRTRRVSCS